MLTLSQAAQQIRTRQISPLELTRHFLSRIERLNPSLNAFITVTGELALSQARQAEEEVKAGRWRGPLHGVPIALKDLLDTAGVRTTAASNQYRDRIPPADAEVVRRLQQSGAVILGKTNLHEFAFGVSGIVSAFGAVRNPWNLDRITGGSSSGSAAAVAAGLCVAAIGTDTAGSIRCPSALCGTVGHRPSHGLVSNQGVIPLSQSFDTCGPMIHTVEDAVTVLRVLAGLTEPIELNGDVAHMKIGIARAGFFDGMDTGVASCVEEAIRLIDGMTAGTRDVDLKVGAFRTIFNAEIYQYHKTMLERSPELYDPRTLLRVRGCAGITDAAYHQAVTELGVLRAESEKLFEAVDVVLTPAVPIVAPKIADLEAIPLGQLRAYEVAHLLRNTSPFSVLFWPSTVVPCGFTSEGLPVGLQISARPGADATTLSLAHAYQSATEWHLRNPSIAGRGELDA